MTDVKDIVLIGRKGAGKSTIANQLLGENILPLGAIYERKEALNSERSIKVHVINTTVHGMMQMGVQRPSRLRSYFSVLQQLGVSILTPLRKVLAPVWFNVIDPIWRRILAPLVITILTEVWLRFLVPLWRRILYPLFVRAPGVLYFRRLSNRTKSLDNYYMKNLPLKASLVLFIYKYGRITDNEKRELNGAINSMNSDVSTVSALMITGCEDFTLEAKDKAKSEFMSSHHTKHITSFMKKGIFCVGFPDISTLRPPLQELYSSEIKRSTQLLHDLVAGCTTTVELKSPEVCLTPH